jgi:hypothetical protein
MSAADGMVWVALPTTECTMLYNPGMFMLLRPHNWLRGIPV